MFFKYLIRINSWLIKLTKEGYLKRIYKKTWGENRKPAIYHLDKKGARYLIQEENILNKHLKYIADEDLVSFVTINHCIACTEFYLKLKKYAQSQKHKIEFYTETDLDNLEYRRHIKPDAYFKYITKKGSADCFIEIDLETETRVTFKRKIEGYINYYYSKKWQKYFRDFPVIGIICKTQSRLDTLLIDTEEQLRKLGNPEIEFKLTTFEQIKNQGVGDNIRRLPFKDLLDSLL